MPVTRLFTSFQQAHEAIDALVASGIDPSAISVVARSPKDAEALERSTGTSDDIEDVSLERSALEQFVDWLGRVESAAVPGFGAILGTGDIWQDVQAGGSGHGSITGALVGCGVPVDTAANLEQAVEGGKILLVIHGTYDEDAVNSAMRPSEV